MKKIVVFVFLTLFTTVFFIGCSKPVLPIELKESHKRIVIAPFATEEDSANMERRFPLDLATSLSIAEKEREWIYDQSDTLSPVGDSLKNQGLEPNDIFMDSALAAKVGKELNADLIVVGHIANPRIKEWMDNNPVFDMSNQAGISGTTRFILVYQQATLNITVKAVDTQTGNAIWLNGEDKGKGFTGYTKYIREFQTQDPAKEYSRVAEEQIRADIRKHMLSQIGHQLLPEKISGRPVPDILAKPDRPLVRAGGKPILW